MRIYLHEITDQDTELDFTQDEPWVVKSVERVDETSDEPEMGFKPVRPAASVAARAPRPVVAHFTLRKVDDVVVLDGSVDTHVELICSRCAMPFRYETHPHFSALFCKDPDMAGIAHLQGAGKPVGQTKGFARHAHDFEADAHAAQDLDITYLAEDYIDLGDVLTEQLQLQVPFQPLCKESCKGMCAQCGADLNVGRCACAKLAKPNAFSALAQLKLEPKTHT